MSIMLDVKPVIIKFRVNLDKFLILNSTLILKIEHYIEKLLIIFDEYAKFQIEIHVRCS